MPQHEPVGRFARVSLDVRDAAIVTVSNHSAADRLLVRHNTSGIDTDRKVTVSAQDEPLTALLDKLFAGSIAYTLRDSTSSFEEN